MRRNILALLISLGLIAALIGCSGSSGELTIPRVDNNRDGNSSGTLCLGAWQVAVNKTTGELNVYGVRGSDLALNVLAFLEPPVLKNLSIDFTSLVLNPPVLEVDVILTHPIPDPVFTGFDVRGVVFGPALINADGYTPYMQPDDFTGEPFGYKDGLLGAPDSYGNYSDKLNGYKYFADGLGPDDNIVTFFTNEDNIAKRGKFANGSSNRRHYKLSWEGKPSPITFLVFNYAVYANYDWPVGDPPYELNDFPISTCNSQEAFCFRATAGENTLYYFEGKGGGELTLNVELWDWQGFDDYDVTMQAGTVFGPSPVHHDTTSPGSTSKSQIFTFTALPGTPPSINNIGITVTATDASATFGSSWFMGLLPTGNPLYDEYVYAVWYTSVPVSPESPLSFHVELDAKFAINTTNPEFAPGIIRNLSGKLFIGYMEYISGNRSAYYISDTSGTSWSKPAYSSWGGGPSRPHLNAMGVDAEGSAYSLLNNYTTPTTWSILVEYVQQPPTNSGIYTIGFAHGNGLIFSSDGYAIPFGDQGNTINYKRALAANAPMWGGDWLCWNTLTAQIAAPAPARLSHTRNVIRTSANEIYVVYFSATADKWIKLAHATEAVTPGTWSYKTAYDGTAEGRDIARDPTLYYESDGDFHCAFITHDSTPKEYITYTRSVDGSSWSKAVTAYQVSGTDVLDDPTVDAVVVGGYEIVVITYLEGGKVYLVFSWDEGETWRPPVLLSTGSDTTPDTCSTANGYVHTVWEHAVGSESDVEYIRARFVED